ncbi:hypothetical protein GCM10020229_06810 [Kitasatospora albolonga]
MSEKRNLRLGGLSGCLALLVLSAGLVALLVWALGSTSGTMH